MTVAKFKRNVAPINSEFGEKLARKWFGDDVVDSLPEYVKGPKKGQKKGWLTWEKAISGGWVYKQLRGDGFHSADAYVARPNHIRNKAIEIDHEVVCSITGAVEDDLNETDRKIALEEKDLEEAKANLEEILTEGAGKYAERYDFEDLIIRQAKGRIEDHENRLATLKHKKRYGGTLNNLLKKG